MRTCGGRLPFGLVKSTKTKSPRAGSPSSRDSRRARPRASRAARASSRSTTSARRALGGLARGAAEAVGSGGVGAVVEERATTRRRPRRGGWAARRRRRRRRRRRGQRRGRLALVAAAAAREPRRPCKSRQPRGVAARRRRAVVEQQRRLGVHPPAARGRRGHRGLGDALALARRAGQRAVGVVGRAQRGGRRWPRDDRRAVRRAALEVAHVCERAPPGGLVRVACAWRARRRPRRLVRERCFAC